ncbi:MAG: hypothetical protein RKO66_01820 [Candidatus Contendobacter sp.]|nr:hypothetical protein [Candidatus Contendobacter sp.]MDS4057146.1 hypothetical protein [Candidatus Contendobacter sp.]
MWRRKVKWRRYISEKIEDVDNIMDKLIKEAIDQIDSTTRLQGNFRQSEEVFP